MPASPVDPPTDRQTATHEPTHTRADSGIFSTLVVPHAETVPQAVTPGRTSVRLPRRRADSGRIESKFRTTPRNRTQQHATYNMFNHATPHTPHHRAACILYCFASEMPSSASPSSAAVEEIEPETWGANVSPRSITATLREQKKLT